MKFQQEIISYLLIFLLTIFLISLTIYFYLPQIKKIQDDIKVKTIFKNMFDRSIENSLASSLQRVINLNGISRVDTGYDVYWNITQKSIEAKFYSLVCPTEPNDNFVFIDGCVKSVCYLGLDLFYNVEVKSRRLQDECEITYRLTLVNNLKSEDQNYNITISFIPSQQNFSSKYLVLSLVRKEYIGNSIFYDIGISI
jgi:hypothetical protein